MWCLVTIADGCQCNLGTQTNYLQGWSGGPPTGDSWGTGRWEPDHEGGLHGCPQELVIRTCHRAWFLINRFSPSPLLMERGVEVTRACCRELDGGTSWSTGGSGGTTQGLVTEFGVTMIRPERATKICPVTNLPISPYNSINLSFIWIILMLLVALNFIIIIYSDKLLLLLCYNLQIFNASLT